MTLHKHVKFQIDICTGFKDTEEKQSDSMLGAGIKYLIHFTNLILL